LYNKGKQTEKGGEKDGRKMPALQGRPRRYWNSIFLLVTSVKMPSVRSVVLRSHPRHSRGVSFGRVESGTSNDKP